MFFIFGIRGCSQVTPYLFIHEGLYLFASDWPGTGLMVELIVFEPFCTVIKRSPKKFASKAVLLWHCLELLAKNNAHSMARLDKFRWDAQI